MQTILLDLLKKQMKKNRHSCPKTRMAIKIITVRRTTTTARGSDSRGSLWNPCRGQCADGEEGTYPPTYL